MYYYLLNIFNVKIVRIMIMFQKMKNLTFYQNRL
jgi:hypothetical protein